MWNASWQQVVMKRISPPRMYIVASNAFRRLAADLSSRLDSLTASVCRRVRSVFRGARSRGHGKWQRSGTHGCNGGFQKVTAHEAGVEFWHLFSGDLRMGWPSIR